MAICGRMPEEYVPHNQPSKKILHITNLGSIDHYLQELYCTPFRHSNRRMDVAQNSLSVDLYNNLHNFILQHILGITRVVQLEKSV